jgi:hypothetical protein
MGEPGAGRILAVMGSGETSPTMVTVHRALVARLGTRQPSAVLLETPYRFQENADDISAKARKYFADSVGLAVTILAGTDDAAGMLLGADWVFSGPGSPTYALAQWAGSPVAGSLRDRILAGRGVTVLASAAAVTLGVTALPVYEIYKVGQPPHWLDGLDLMAAIGLNVTVIPHYNNTEGGNHDTRYCYLGERRLAKLEAELPAGAAVLGVDEHTAAVFDLAAETVEVSGRGGVTVRRQGVSTVLPAGTVIALGQLRDLVNSGTVAGAPVAATAPAENRPAPPPDALPDLTVAAQRRFDDAERCHDAEGMAAAILMLETAIHDWAADTEEDQGTEHARAVLRTLITRLGRAAQGGLTDPRERLSPAVGRLIVLRGALRTDGSYQAADAIRDALAAAGVRLHDDVDGTHWELDPPAGP